jgi:hypothetical protein
VSVPWQLDAVARLQRALEAFEVGDHELALRIVDDLRRDLEHPREQLPHQCPFCGSRFPWPGLLDDHVQRVHGVYERRRAS